MEVGDKLVVWGGVHPGTIAIQYGKSVCEILGVTYTDDGRVYHIKYEDPDDPEDQWTGWVHEKQVDRK